MSNLEKRIEELEQLDAADTGLMLLIIEHVEPGQLERRIDALKLQDGLQCWQRAEDEAEDDFKRRVRADLERLGYAKPVLLLANADNEVA